MTTRVLTAFLMVLTLASCGTRLNPMNWFGNDREQRIEVVETTEDEDRRQLVAEVISLDVDPYPGGAIIRAVGLPPRQGFWEADLVEVSRLDGELVLEFRVYPPVEQTTRVSTQQSREILAGTSLNTFELDGIRSITIIAQQNRRSVRRR